MWMFFLGLVENPRQTSRCLQVETDSPKKILCNSSQIIPVCGLHSFYSREISISLDLMRKI